MKLGISDFRHVLLSVGNLVELKGHALMLEALSDLSSDVILLVVGVGQLREQLERQARSLGLNERVKFVGRVNQKDLKWYYSAADMLLLASSREGMPNVVLESIACGTPVIATDVGGVPEIISDGVTGFLVKERTAASFSRAIKRGLEANLDTRLLRHAARLFSWESTSRGQLKVFNNAILDFRERAGL